jgi:hypothetical protein
MNARAELAQHLDTLALTAQAITGLIGRLNPVDLRELLEGCPFHNIHDTLLDLDSWAGSVVETLEQAARNVIPGGGGSKEATA